MYIETPDERDGFHNATCWLPDYVWEDVVGYSEEEMIKNNVHFMLSGQFRN